ncbi:TonB-dependent receptor domain-containing protein [Tsuneonella sp. HG094]
MATATTKAASAAHRPLEVVYKPLASLTPDPRNARTHPKRQIEQIVRSIAAFGFTNPVLADEAGNLIAGHGRLRAAKEMGLAEVPVIELAGLSEPQKKALRLADNKIALNAGWDLEILKLELADLSLPEIDIDLSLTGFSAGEIDVVLGDTPDPDDEVTGLGNYRDFLFDITIPQRLLANTGPYVISGGNGTQARNGIRPDNVVFTASGAGNKVTRDLFAIDFGIERQLGFGPFTSIKVGGYYSREKANQIFQENANLGAQLGNLPSDIFKLNDAVTSGAPFFGGGAPGAERDGFLSLNIPVIENAIYPILTTIPPGTTFTLTDPQLAVFFPELTVAARRRIDFAKILAQSPRNPLTGFIPRFPLTRVLGQNFTSDRDNLELFAMTKFDLEEFASFPIRGNLGLRYVRAKLSGLVEDQALQFYTALGFTQADFRPGYFQPATPATGTFSSWLPSANLVFDVTQNLVLRAAYYKTFEAFDLAEFSPSPTRIITDVDPDTGETQASVRIDVNRFGLKPRSSTAFDLNASWYNRPGSVIAIGYFRKNVVNDILTQDNFCPVGTTFSADGQDFGPLFLDASGRCRINEGEVVVTNNPRIVINQIVNSPTVLKVNGLEFQIQQAFDFLPGFLRNTGGIFNYTRVRSKSASGMKLYNVAGDTYNIIGYYEDDVFQARLAYNHASAIALEGSGTFTGSSSMVRPRGQLDLSMAVKPAPAFEVRLELYNLTNSRREEYEGFSEYNRVADFDGRTGSLGVTVKF